MSTPFWQKKKLLFAGIGSKQQSLKQLPGNLSEGTLFVVWKFRQFFHRVNVQLYSRYAWPVGFRSLFKDTYPPTTTKVLLEYSLILKLYEASSSKKTF